MQQNKTELTFMMTFIWPNNILQSWVLESGAACAPRACSNALNAILLTHQTQIMKKLFHSFNQEQIRHLSPCLTDDVFGNHHIIHKLNANKQHASYQQDYYLQILFHLVLASFLQNNSAGLNLDSPFM